MPPLPLPPLPLPLPPLPLSESPPIDLRISRTSSKNDSSTLMRDLADDSRNLQPNDLARSAPSLVATTRESSRSHLLPTSTMGTCSSSLTLRICSRKDEISSNDDREVME